MNSETRLAKLDAALARIQHEAAEARRELHDDDVTARFDVMSNSLLRWAVGIYLVWGVVLYLIAKYVH
jgi:hypothetical protein